MTKGVDPNAETVCLMNVFPRGRKELGILSILIKKKKKKNTLPCKTFHHLLTKIIIEFHE